MPRTSSSRPRSGSSSGSAPSRSAGRTRMRCWPPISLGAAVGLAVLWSLRRRRERAEQEARARLEQRLEIARELHDVVAHHVSVIGIQAAAARRTLGGPPDATAAALAAIEASSRAAVQEMQQLVITLRRDDDPATARTTAAETATGPGPRDLPDLFDRIDAGRSAGRTATGFDEPRLAGLPGVDPGRPLPSRPGGPDQRAPARRVRPTSRSSLQVEPATDDAVDRRAAAPISRAGCGPGWRPRDPGDARAHARRRRHPGRRSDGRRRLPVVTVPVASQPSGGGWPMTTPIRVVIVDDQQLVRVGFRHDPRDRARHRGRRRGRGWRPGHRGRPLATTGRRPDGHPDAGHGRARGDPPPPRAGRPPPPPRGHHPDDVRAGRVRLRGAARRAPAGSSSRTRRRRTLVDGIRSVVAGGGLLSPGVTAKRDRRLRPPPGKRPRRAPAGHPDRTRARGARAWSAAA